MSDERKPGEEIHDYIQRVGKPVGLSDPVESHDVTLTIEDASTIMMLHQNVLEVEDDDGTKILLVESGAGLGNDLLIIDYQASDGKKHRGALLMRAIAREWIKAVDPNVPKNLLKSLS